MLLVSNVAGKTTVLPPGQKEFTIAAICDPSCFSGDSAIPLEGINIIMGAFHTHITGTGALLRQFRGSLELPPIHVNYQLDNPEQFVRLFPKPRRVLPVRMSLHLKQLSSLILIAYDAYDVI